MDSFAAIFKELYTSFLLRDFAGKIIPGTMLFIVLSSLFFSIEEIFNFLVGKINLHFIFLVGGSAWISILAIQGISLDLGIWTYYPRYYPEGVPLTEAFAQTQVQQFLRLACQVDKNQYERLVVIKEASGNFFSVCLLSIFALLIKCLKILDYDWPSQNSRKLVDNFSSSLSLAMVLAIITIGAREMNKQHVEKQYEFAVKFLEKGEAPKCPADKPEK